MPFCLGGEDEISQRRQPPTEVQVTKRLSHAPAESCKPDISKKGAPSQGALLIPMPMTR